MFTSLMSTAKSLVSATPSKSITQQSINNNNNDIVSDHKSLVKSIEAAHSTTTNSITVAIRIKPDDTNQSYNNNTQFQLDSSKSTIYDNITNKAYAYDHVFQPHTTQSDIFDICIHTSISHVLHGMNSCILAYGQTGSGKTYTMSGNNLYENERSIDLSVSKWLLDPHRGIIPRVISYIYSYINNNNQYTISVSYVELYMEQVYDLLDINKPTLLIKEHISTESSEKSIELNCIKRVCISVESALRCITEGQKRRTTGETQSNSRSSRSHAIVLLHLHNKSTSQSSVLHLVDLAGSEKTKKAMTHGLQQKEGNSINSSLSTLNRVLRQIQQQQQLNKRDLVNKQFIAYRDSKLTFLLRDSLSGHSKTLLIANISLLNDDNDFTLSTLQFAAVAKQVKYEHKSLNKIDEKLLSKELQVYIQNIRDSRIGHTAVCNETEYDTIQQLHQSLLNQFNILSSSQNNNPTSNTGDILSPIQLHTRSNTTLHSPSGTAQHRRATTKRNFNEMIESVVPQSGVNEQILHDKLLLEQQVNKLQAELSQVQNTLKLHQTQSNTQLYHNSIQASGKKIRYTINNEPKYTNTAVSSIFDRVMNNENQPNNQII